jgi:hypothetical protein
MGDFYELFFEDAVKAAPLLEVTLTTRDKDKPDPIPMCGVPVHAADGYVRRLSAKGHRVAICEQVEDPRSKRSAQRAAGERSSIGGGGRRALVRREVIEVITPGLVGDPQGLPAAGEVALAAVWTANGEAGLAALDASTGTSARRARRGARRAAEALARRAPSASRRARCVVAEGDCEALIAALRARSRSSRSRAPAAQLRAALAPIRRRRPGRDLAAACGVLATSRRSSPLPPESRRACAATRSPTP